MNWKISELDLEVHELTGGNTARLGAFIELSQEFFPDYMRYLPVIQRRAQLPGDVHPLFVEHQWLVEIEGKPAGMSVFKYLPGRDCGIVLDIAVRPDFRYPIQWNGETRLSGIIYELVDRQLHLDAQARGKVSLLGMIGEVRNLALVKYLSVYGFIELPVDYYEPPYPLHLKDLFSPEEVSEVDFERMHLAFRPDPITKPDPFDPALMINLVEALFLDHYGLDSEHWAVRKALDSISCKL